MSCHSVRSCLAPEASFHAVVVASEKRASVVPCGVVRISGSLPRFPIRMTLLTLAMCSPSFQVLKPYSKSRRTIDVREKWEARHLSGPLRRPTDERGESLQGPLPSIYNSAQRC